MSTLLFEVRTYRLGIISAIATMITFSVIIAAKFPRVTIDYASMYGSDYWLYATLNFAIIMSFMGSTILIGMMIAEKIMKNRGYYEIIQKEKETRKVDNS